MPLHPPADVLAAVGHPDTWQALDTTNEQASQVWLAGALVVARRKLGVGRAEAERFSWLAKWAPTAVVQLVASDDQNDWVVAERLVGHPSNQIDAHGDMQGVPATLARALRALHDQQVDVGSFPFAIGWDALAAEIEASVGDLDPSQLPDPYSRYSAERLCEIWVGGRPSNDDLVICHGNPTLANLIIDPAVVGWVGIGRLRLADRHLDLAIAQYNIHRNFGPDAVFAFFEAYEIDPDLVRIDHYLLANLLLP